MAGAAAGRGAGRAAARAARAGWGLAGERGEEASALGVVAPLVVAARSARGAGTAPLPPAERSLALKLGDEGSQSLTCSAERREVFCSGMQNAWIYSANHGMT